jgi:gas vesicle protein
MDNTAKTNKSDSNVWPYVIVGSAIGGAIGYLFMTESGRKIRHTMTHPDELADNLDELRTLVDRKAKVVTDHVHGFMDKAKRSMEEGQYAYREASTHYRSRVRAIESKNNEITSSVHDVVDNVSRKAVTVEESVLDPVCEIGALYRGFERGIRALLNKTDERTLREGPIPINRDQRVRGS